MFQCNHGQNRINEELSSDNLCYCSNSANHTVYRHTFPPTVSSSNSSCVKNNNNATVKKSNFQLAAIGKF